MDLSAISSLSNAGSILNGDVNSYVDTARNFSSVTLDGRNFNLYAYTEIDYYLFHITGCFENEPVLFKIAGGRIEGDTLVLTSAQPENPKKIMFNDIEGVHVDLNYYRFGENIHAVLDGNVHELPLNDNLKYIVDAFKFEVFSGPIIFDQRKVKIFDTDNEAYLFRLDDLKVISEDEANERIELKGIYNQISHLIESSENQKTTLLSKIKDAHKSLLDLNEKLLTFHKPALIEAICRPIDEQVAELLADSRVYKVEHCENTLKISTQFIEYKFYNSMIPIGHLEVELFSKPIVKMPGNIARHPHIYGDKTLCLGDHVPAYIACLARKDFIGAFNIVMSVIAVANPDSTINDIWDVAYHIGVGYDDEEDSRSEVAERIADELSDIERTKKRKCKAPMSPKTLSKEQVKKILTLIK